MSKYRKDLTILIETELEKQPDTANYKELRAALVVQRDEVIFPSARQLRIWQEEAHKAIQRELKARREAKKNQSSLFEE